jgi:hypothetical protein
VAVVQYTFTLKQYTERHNESEYTERYIHYNKNTSANKRPYNIIIKIYNISITIYNITIRTNQVKKSHYRP